MPRPRIGFVGIVDTVRFDVDLIQRLAENLEFHIVIVGGFINNAEKTLPQRPNIHLLGVKRVSELPAYLKAMDVCLMPYRLNEATRNIHPLKLHEYMATGKPVVTTAIPAVESSRDLMYVADHNEDFVQLVSSALAEDDLSLSSKRQDCARQHNWEAHVEKKVELTCQHLLKVG